MQVSVFLADLDATDMLLNWIELNWNELNETPF